MFASVVAPPTAVTRNCTGASSLTVPARRGSPGARTTAMDSPVSIDSLTRVLPERITPSAGTTSPARTSSRSPAASCATATSMSPSPPSAAKRCAVTGNSRESESATLLQRWRATISTKRATVRKKMNIVTESKYTSPACRQVSSTLAP